MRTRSYAMDTEGDSSADTGSSNTDGDTSSATDNTSEFVFDGFKVMFAEKVMLTPVTPVMPTAPLTQAQSRRWH